MSEHDQCDPAGPSRPPESRPVVAALDAATRAVRAWRTAGCPCSGPEADRVDAAAAFVDVAIGRVRR